MFSDLKKKFENTKGSFIRSRKSKDTQYNDRNLKIPKRQSNTVNPRSTNNAMAKRKGSRKVLLNTTQKTRGVQKYQRANQKP